MKRFCFVLLSCIVFWNCTICEASVASLLSIPKLLRITKNVSLAYRVLSNLGLSNFGEAYDLYLSDNSIFDIYNEFVGVVDEDIDYYNFNYDKDNIDSIINNYDSIFGNNILDASTILVADETFNSFIDFSKLSSFEFGNIVSQEFFEEHLSSYYVNQVLMYMDVYDRYIMYSKGDDYFIAYYNSLESSDVRYTAPGGRNTIDFNRYVHGFIVKFSPDYGISVESYYDDIYDYDDIIATNDYRVFFVSSAKFTYDDADLGLAREVLYGMGDLHSMIVPPDLSFDFNQSIENLVVDLELTDDDFLELDSVLDVDDIISVLRDKDLDSDAGAGMDDVPVGFFDDILSFFDNILSSFDKVLGFFDDVFVNLSENLKSLFIPDFEDIKSRFYETKDKVSVKLGFHNWILFEDALTLYAKKPKFEIFIYGQAVTLIDLSYFEGYMFYLQDIIKGFFSFLLLLYNYKMVLYLLRSSHFIKGGK
ncbi:hypothetical protein AN642_01085 [Epulopiscium sp. SCG-B10WGA-EpuloA2]|nr:hypothetical protein AN642_01085 [Epulopiscium sp. SCG-B10WGA-EpuloA2]